jgi:predicted dehydrogenase
MRTIDVGIIGGGLIAQVEHLPNILGLPNLFRCRGIAEPSAKVRQHIEKRFGVKTFATAEALLAEPLEAVVIAAPDSYHADLSVAALARGLHIFCEKPLCYHLEDADRVIAARDRAERVFQVGYMKRYDPSWRLLRQMIDGQGERLRLVSVEVNDPDSWPFVAHRDFVNGDDVSKDLVDEGRTRRAEQVGKVVGRPLAPAEVKGIAGPYFSSMVHDVNLVHGLLDVMEISTGEIAGAVVFAGGTGGQGTIRLSGDRLWTVFHLAVPKLADYLERVSLFFDDRIYVLEFPAPYLNHQPTVLYEKRSSDLHAETILHRASYAEAFVEELRDWWKAIVEGAKVSNTVEQARRDLVLLGKLARMALSQPA